MDKLQPQTVYVPVDWNPENPFILTDAREPSYQTLKQLPGVYPLTAEQILTLVDDAMSAQASEMPGEDEWDNFVKQFLKSKGVEI